MGRACVHPTAAAGRPYCAWSRASPSFAPRARADYGAIARARAYDAPAPAPAPDYDAPRCDYSPRPHTAAGTASEHHAGYDARCCDYRPLANHRNAGAFTASEQECDAWR